MQLDHDHPCLICGAPWDHEDNACSGRCFERGPGEANAYRVGLVKRVERGWDSAGLAPTAA